MEPQGQGATPEQGAERVARQLDQLNLGHQRLLDLLYERLRRIAAANPGDIVTLVSQSFFIMWFIIYSDDTRRKICILAIIIQSFTIAFNVIT